jgi:hypothetical protein
MARVKSADRILLEGKLPALKKDYLSGLSTIKLTEKYLPNFEGRSSTTLETVIKDMIAGKLPTKITKTELNKRPQIIGTTAKGFSPAKIILNNPKAKAEFIKFANAKGNTVLMSMEEAGKIAKKYAPKDVKISGYTSRAGFMDSGLRDLITKKVQLGSNPEGEVNTAESIKKAKQKRDSRIKITAPFKATGTPKFAFHHIMPIGGEVPLTTNDIAIINQRMNSALGTYNKQLNSIADGISNAYNKQPPDLKRIDRLNKAGESIVRKAVKELPKEYRNLIGFNKLQPVFDEYGTVINLSPERVGGVNQKTPGIKLEELNKEQAKALRKQIKDDALSLEKSTTTGKKFPKGKVGLAAAALAGITGAAVADEPPIKYNDELGAFVDPLNDEKVSQATMLDWAANNPMPTAAIASAPLLSKTVRKGTGKLLSGLLKTLGSPTAAAGFAGLTIKENLEKGKSIPDAVIDPLVGVELLFPELAKRATTSPTGTGLLSKAGRFLLNPIPRVAAAMTPVGMGITALGIGKELYNAAQAEQDRINAFTPEEREDYFAEQQELMDVSA